MPNVQRYLFGSFVVDEAQRRLLNGEVPVALAPKPFELLLLLLERAGQAVPRDELKQRLWPRMVVEPGSLHTAVAAVRRAIEPPGAPRCIEAVRKHGYRFCAEVAVVGLQFPAYALAWPGPGVQARGGDSSTWIASGAQVVQREARAAAAGAAPRVLAVAQFACCEPDADCSFRAYALADALIGRLSRSSLVRVRPLSPTLAVQRAANDDHQLGAALDADWVLGGQLQAMQGRLGANVHLIDTASEAVVWRQRFEPEDHRGVALEDAIVGSTIKVIAAQVRQSCSAAPLRQTEVAEAHHAYYKGRWHIAQRTPEALRTGLVELRRAVALDPAFAAAWVAIAECACSLAVHHVLAAADARPIARHAITQAIACAPDSADALAARARYRAFFELDLRAAQVDAERAIALAPTDAMVRHTCGMVMGFRGEFQAAAEQMAIGRAVEPLLPLLTCSHALMLAAAGQFEEAGRICRAMLALEPDDLRALATACEVALLAGDTDHAVKLADRMGALVAPEAQLAARHADTRATVYAHAGRLAEVQALLDHLPAQGAPLWRARVLVAMAQYDQALDVLEHAAATNAPVELAGMAGDPQLRPLHGHLRFLQLRSQLRLK